MNYVNLCNTPPMAVMVQTETKLLSMTCEQGKWVDLENQISVWNKSNEIENTWYLTSPQTAIVRVMLRFKHDNESRVSILGDQWERGYGDLEWRNILSQRVLPWFFMLQGKDEASGKNRTDGYGVKTNPNAFCFWQYTDEDITLVFDVRCLGRGVLLKEKVLEMATIVSYEGKEYKTSFESAKEFSELMCTNRVLPREPIYGGNNWYYAYGRSSEEEIIRDSKRVASWAKDLSNRPFMVIDACWQQVLYHGITCSGGPYEYGNEKFPDMKKLADSMREIGVRPGIWCRPLVTSAKVEESFILRKVGEGYVLDPTIPEVLTLIGEDIARISSWGYELIKHDFSTYDIFDKWGFEMGYELTKETKAFANTSLTTAEVMKSLYRTIYENAGSAYIIGCNTVGHLITGWAQIQRTGDDTSGYEWERTRKMGINTLAYRMPQHNVFFACDADCVGLTEKVPLDLNKQWLDVLSKSGTPLFVSVDPEVISEELEEALREAFLLASEERKPAIPCDWENNTTPCEWIWFQKEREINQKYQWNDQHTMRLQWNDIKGNEGEA